MGYCLRTHFAAIGGQTIRKGTGVPGKTREMHTFSMCTVCFYTIQVNNKNAPAFLLLKNDAILTRMEEMSGLPRQRQWTSLPVLKYPDNR